MVKYPPKLFTLKETLCFVPFVTNNDMLWAAQLV